MIGRVSTYGLSEKLAALSQSVQSRLAEKQVESSSTLKAETYGELGSAAGRLVNLESALARSQSYTDSIQTASDRVTTMHSALGDMADLMTQLRAKASAATTGTNSQDLNNVGQGLLADLANLMNTRQDGRYLFAGSLTGTAPVDTAKLGTPTTPSTADTTYYQGDDHGSVVRVSENQTLDYGVTADGTAFEQALRAANILAHLTTSPLDTTALTEASDLATKALDGLLAAQGTLSVAADRLDRAKTVQSDAASLLQTMIGDTKSVDTAQVAVEVSNYNTQLQASYSALAAINKTHLLNYL